MSNPTKEEAHISKLWTFSTESTSVLRAVLLFGYVSLKSPCVEHLVPSLWHCWEVVEPLRGGA
jgi:hypothetical protein